MPDEPSAPPRVVDPPVRDDAFDFSALPALGPLPLVEESRPGSATPVPSRTSSILLAIALATLAGSYAGWSGVARLVERGGMPDKSRREIATATNDPATTGSIRLVLRPTMP